MKASTGGVIAGAMWMLSIGGILEAVGGIEAAHGVLELLIAGAAWLGTVAAGYYAYGRGLQRERESEGNHETAVGR